MRWRWWSFYFWTDLISEQRQRSALHFALALSLANMSAAWSPSKKLVTSYTRRKMALWLNMSAALSPSKKLVTSYMRRKMALWLMAITLTSPSSISPVTQRAWSQPGNKMAFCPFDSANRNGNRSLRHWRNISELEQIYAYISSYGF
jgi:hypothetical protein